MKDKVREGEGKKMSPKYLKNMVEKTTFCLCDLLFSSLHKNSQTLQRKHQTVHLPFAATGSHTSLREKQLIWRSAL